MEQRYLTLTLGEDLYAFAISAVREILDMTEITRIPQTPPYMRGVVNVRGIAVPVIDLRSKFNLGQVEQTLQTRIIIVEINDGHTTSVMGALADSVKEVLDIDTSSIAPPPAMGGVTAADYIKGISRQGERFILIVNVDKVFSSEEIVDLSRVMESAAASPNAHEDSAPAG
ncbi:chemotaxis protein CheW [Solidesulfovibrio alcoholivorans]|uniref:chemotaxis protein CheW n=1 Tax=Solidesulfovibrio alcoholivorans TaxID=81406 RepID=UPI001FE075DD|nr:chemotaxis protein CheW [Solidesulfovibrio alcoholivorans]